MLKREEFAKIIKLLASSKQKRFDADDIEAWYQLAMMQSYPLEAWRAACIKLAYDAGDWPNFGKLAVMAAEHVNGLQLSHGEAFEVVMRQVRQYSKPEDGRRLPELTEKHEATVMQCGGWDRFCDCPPDQRGTLAAQFRMAWQDSSGTEKRLQNLPEQVRPKLDGPVREALTHLSTTMRLEER